MATGSTVREAVRLAPPYDAVRVTGVDAVTAAVLSGAVAEDAPAGTVTVAPETAEFELVMETAAPEAGAAALSVTVTVTGVPPVTEAELTDRVESVAADEPTVWPQDRAAPAPPSS